MDWNEVPSVVLVHIYSLLSREDRLKASSVCKNWRQPVFQVPFSPSLNLNLHYESDGPKVEFLAQHFVHKISDLTLSFDPTIPSNLDVLETVLAKLESNTHLKSLKLRCSEDSLTKDIFCGTSTSGLILRTHFIRKVLQPILKVLKARSCLETFSFPLVNELGHFEDAFYSSLEQTSKLYTIHNLFLASLQTSADKATVESSGEKSASSPPKLLTVKDFVNLQMLSVNHESLSDEILGSIGLGSHSGGLRRLNLIATQATQNVSNNGWVDFANNNPKCGVRLTIVGDGIIFDHTSNLLFQPQNLTHFRALYCKDIRMPTLNAMISWNEKSLEHIELVHENYDWMDYIAHPNEEDQFLDPIIYAAWRCQKLNTLKIGFLYCGQSLVGIARLKGPSLTNLEISRSKVIYHNIQQLSHEVSKALCRPWKPTEDSNERRKKPNVSSKKYVHALQALVSDEH